ncbi:flagellar protein FlaG [Campylobacter subantarcticus LMG 24377]|uniref:Flagellar protein FlaG n=2 Tax=Campylobacter subantarcticus TaxID=497724 RepID=A0A0A8HCM3_9BACT|nr:flagellar protein FlaG [Campylobacter subantarcticus]EAJ1260736.1 flagellar biosynthesis protein FlaG [Campylobacter lari]AJC90659.1 flagellar protein FlaG [Campylobacter subantarcticus LMG 24374]AJC92421.1 flagellar protein FlaG [Campylobacter subantarcticus LMG 24377]EAL3938643.1 flagellar biosynthesis protein FlaG [Campylobacter lari]MPB99520.1 flagellar biosynthesis protein FlaG [Campylobacter subantarcticus]
MDIGNIQRDVNITHLNTKSAEKTSQQENKQQIDLKDQDENLNDKLKNATEKLNQQMETLETNVRFAYNDKINEIYVNVIEKDTGRLIRKIPSEEVMKLIEHFKGVIGTIFDKES